MARVVILGLLALLTYADCPAQGIVDEIAPIEQIMTPDRMAEAGLNKLSPEQLRELNSWLKWYTETVAQAIHDELESADNKSGSQPRFRLYQTENIWTSLLLDSRTGKLWQVSIGSDENTSDVVLPVNTTPLATSNQYGGRFALSATGNMWNFILLDQESGSVWRCQFSMKGENYRFCSAIR